MTKENVIQRFCELSARVMQKKFKYQIPADCFCCKSNFPKEWNYSYSEQVIEFIEQAVREKMEKEKI